jgi:hypothetical protein
MTYGYMGGPVPGRRNPRGSANIPAPTPPKGSKSDRPSPPPPTGGA